MLDTLGLISPDLSEFEAARIEQQLKTRAAWDNSTGEYDYEFISGTLDGSFDERVNVRVKREKFRSWKDCKGKTHNDLVKSPPYVCIEGSVHKAILGHNVYGGPLDPVAAARWFITDVARRLGVNLPAPDSWTFDRIDWSEVYNLGSYEAVEEYIRGMSFARYPRRKCSRYASESVFFPGTTTATKFYHKGPEFSKHDARRFEKIDKACAILLQNTANTLLRVEASIKSKKLKADFGERPKVAVMIREYLETTHDRETARIIAEGEKDVEVVRNNEEVRNRLYSHYGLQLGNTLFGTWSSLVLTGEDRVRATMSRPTFYRHRQQLQAANISWIGTDVCVKEHTAIPVGFTPRRSDPRRLTEQAPEVIKALSPYCTAVA